MLFWGIMTNASVYYYYVRGRGRGEENLLALVAVIGFKQVDLQGGFKCSG